MSDRGAQRVCAAFATGALEVFAVGPLSAIYKRATGALEVIAVGPDSTIYSGRTLLSQRDASRPRRQ
ncbi:hypothetical protein DVK07_01730 [Halorubrum sp. Atlit-26R]|nr:hypothetical protein DVK07_01730 [Halorubrum sp. Atlit-26R]